MKINKLLYFSIIFLFFTLKNFSQVSKDSELFKTMKIQDSIFFERSFNLCDMEYTQKVVHKDLRFYHDKGGYQERDKFFENTKNNLCSNFEKKPIRKVDAESLEVFPLYNDGVLYGVIQNGTHRFYIREKNKEDKYTGKARFTSVYILEDNIWKLKEVLSFDHKY